MKKVEKKQEGNEKELLIITENFKKFVAEFISEGLVLPLSLGEYQDDDELYTIRLVDSLNVQFCRVSRADSIIEINYDVYRDLIINSQYSVITYYLYLCYLLKELNGDINEANICALDNMVLDAIESCGGELTYGDVSFLINQIIDFRKNTILENRCEIDDFIEPLFDSIKSIVDYLLCDSYILQSVLFSADDGDYDDSDDDLL